MRHSILLWMVLGLGILVLGGCGLAGTAPESSSTATAVAPTAAPPPTVVPIPVDSTGLDPTGEVVAVSPSQLRVWLPPEIGSRTQASAERLTEQLRDFNSRYPELELVIEQKQVAGAGGILDYLRTGSEVAPGILPDLIAVPSVYLAEVAVRQLVSPLNELGVFSGDDAAAQDIYSAALHDVRDGDMVFGYPFAMTGMTHMVSSSDVVTWTVPLQWSAFISDTRNTLLVPVDGRDGALLGLQYYLANGGTLTNELGQVDLQVDPLARTLEQLSQGRTALLQSSQLKSAAEAWQLYELGVSNHVFGRPDVVLADRQAAALDNSADRRYSYRPLPGPAGALTPLVGAWAWAVTATDPVSRNLATELLLYLVNGQQLLQWTQDAQVVAADRSVNAALGAEDRYYVFLDSELERAQPLPQEAGSRILDALGAAVYEVLTTDRTPQSIAEDAVARLRQ